MLIEGNTIIDPLGYGIYMTSGNRAQGATQPSGPAYVQNNSISGLYRSSSARDIFVSSNSRNIKFYHNSVSVTSGTSTTSSAFYASTTTTIANLDIQNNSFAKFGNSSGYALYVRQAAVNGLDYNNYYNNGDTSRIIWHGSVVGLGALTGFGGSNFNAHHGDP